MTSPYSTYGLTLLIGFLLSSLGGCDYKSARQREQAFEAIERSVRYARERFNETGNPVHELHAKHYENGMALLYPELPSVPTPFLAYIAGIGRLSKGEIIVLWIERGKDVDAIEVRTANETFRYQVKYNKQTLGDRYDDEVFRYYNVYFADKADRFPTLRSDEVIVLSNSVCDGLLSEKMSASIRLLYLDGATSDWLDCIPTIGGERTN